MQPGRVRLLHCRIRKFDWEVERVGEPRAHLTSPPWISHRRGSIATSIVNHCCVSLRSFDALFRMNFGFHPDRDNNGTAVSCEHHDDTGGYHETTVDLGFNYRMSFSVFKISLRKGHIQWLVGQDKEAPKLIYEANATLTEPMTTRIILRTNFRDGDPGYLPDHVFEISHFRFVPVDTRV